MSLAREFHTWLNAQSFIPGQVNFNVASEYTSEPYYVMVPVSDPMERTSLCKTDTGQALWRFDGFGIQRYDLYDIMDKLRKDIMAQARRVMGAYSVWFVESTGVTGYGTEDRRIYRYTFTLTLHWEDN